MEKRTNVLERNRWADELLKGLPKEEQIKWLTEKLVRPSEDGEDELDLMEGLEMVFQDEVAFRKQLCHIYSQLVVGEFPKVVAEFPKLTTAIAKKILKGWDWFWKAYGDWNTPEYYRRTRRVLHVNPDAKDCFEFFCQIYEHSVKSESDHFTKLLMSILHKHVNTHRYNEGYREKWVWGAEDLNEWILAEGIPSDIKVILTGTRVRIGGSTLAQREILLSQSFQTQARSPEAIALMKAQMEVIRQTEELAKTLIEQVRSHDIHGAPNPEGVVPCEGEVEWELESAEVARVKITFRYVSDPARRGNYPKSIADVQAARDQLLSEVENPPRILIKAEGPDSFHYKEE